MDSNQRKKEILQAYKQRLLTGGTYVITNTATGRQLLLCELDLKGARNRFDFMSKMGSCVNSRLSADWRKYGPQSFAFRVLEELEQKETQTADDFKEDLAVLEELWREKLGAEALY